MSPAIDPLGTLLQNVGEGVCLVDAEGRFVVGNRRHAELLELPDDFRRTGDPIDKLLEFLRDRGDYGSDEAYREIRRRISEATQKALVYERPGTGGRTLEVRLNPVPAGGFVVIVADVTEQRAAAESLRRSEARFRDFAEVASDFQWETDAELRIASMSETYAARPAQPLADLYGRRLWEVPGIEDPGGENWRDFRQALMDRRPVSGFRYVNVDREGRRLHRRLSGRPVYDPGGTFMGYRFATRDETGEVEARARAHAAEDLLRRSIESIPEGFAVYDPEDRLVLMNRRYLGHRPENVPYDPAEDAWMKPGLSFEEIIRGSLERGDFPAYAGREQAFIDDRLAAHREGKGRPIMVRAVSGRWAQTRDYRLPDGSTVVVRTDVTELVDRENALQDYHSRLDLALRTAGSAYWELDLSNRTHRLMPNYYAMLGYGEADAPSDRSAWLSLVHPDDIATIDAAHQVAFRDEADHRYEFRIRAADGSWRWVLSSFRAVAFDAKGRPTRLLGIDTDITGRKEAQLTLQHERDRAQRYLDIAGVILVVVDVALRITLLNRKGCEILGVTEAEALGLDWFEAFAPPAERAEQVARFSAFLAGGVGPVNYGEIPLITRRGERRLVAWHCSLLRDADGKITGCLSSGEDVTEQRAAMRKRDEYQTLIAATAEASPDGILVADTDGRYLFWNNRLKEMWELSDAYLQGRRSGSLALEQRLAHFADRIVDPRPFLDEARRIYLGQHDATRRFAEVHLKDGRVLEQFTASVSVGEPPITAIAWIYRDITAAKRRDDELARSQRLAALGELSGGMAHELNNLLMVISGHLELVQGQPAADRKIAEFVETASTAVRRGADLIQGVLAFARQQPLSPRLVDANLLVSDTVRLLPKLLGERIKVELRPAESLWKTVVDPGRLETTLVSLALNARDAMPNGGRLVVETANRSLDREDAGQFGDVEAGDYVLISVRDDGCGMAPETAERAFEPFFTTKPFGTGKGLGLSMVFGFVKQSGGHVALDSALGRGTTITIFLPRAPQQEISARPRFLAPAAAPGGKTVLFVEDEPAVSAVAQAFFDKLGYKVLAVPNGPHAVQVLQSGEPVDLLFTDVMLPEGMTGKETADAARRLRPGIKVLFVSGYATDVLQSEGRLDADSILLQKPYRRADLAEALRKLG